MRSRLMILIFLAPCLFVSLNMPPSAHSQAPPPDAGAVVYKPPMRGAPAGGGRIAAAVRGKEEDAPVILVLAPDHVGFTSRKQPVLYWYISKPTTGHIEFTLNDEKRGETVLKADLPAPKQAGIQEINLADHKVELSPGVVYQWFVTLEPDPGQPAKDIYNGGAIMYQEPSPELNGKLAAAGKTGGAPAVYASEGIWYDALSATWKPSKNDKSLKQQRLSLLKQVGFGASGPGKTGQVVEGEKGLLTLLEK